MTHNLESVTGLKDQVQTLRDKARDVLRMEAIQKRMHIIYKHKRKIEVEYPDILAEKKKEVARWAYRLDQLNPLDPDFEAMTKDLETDLESATQSLASANTEIQEYIQAEQKRIAELEAEISQIESGELTVVSIDDADKLTRKAIRKLMFVK
jgi:chromosome segregation ATPase